MAYRINPVFCYIDHKLSKRLAPTFFKTLLEKWTGKRQKLEGRPGRYYPRKMAKIRQNCPVGNQAAHRGGLTVQGG